MFICSGSCFEKHLEQTIFNNIYVENKLIDLRRKNVCYVKYEISSATQETKA